MTDTSQSTVRATGVFNDATYRAMVEFRVKRKRGETLKSQTITDQIVDRLYYIIVLFPVGFFLASHFVFHMEFIPAAAIAVLWFISFIMAGLLYHRSVVSSATQRPADTGWAMPRDYSLEDGCLVTRTTESEYRLSLKRADDLVITPDITALGFGNLGLVFLPFGSASSQPDQTAFLDALTKQVPLCAATGISLNCNG